MLSSPDAMAAQWSRVHAALSCLPNYATDLAGRVFHDLLNEPDEAGLGWAGGEGKGGGGAGGGKPMAPLGDYYLQTMDAIDAFSPGEAMFFIQGGGQTALGLAGRFWLVRGAWHACLSSSSLFSSPPPPPPDERSVGRWLGHRPHTPARH